MHIVINADCKFFPKGNFTFRMVVYALPSKFAYPFKALKI